MVPHKRIEGESEEGLCTVLLASLLRLHQYLKVTSQNCLLDRILRAKQIIVTCVVMHHVNQ